MALNRSFRNAAIGGFNKEDVLNYIDEMTENTRTLEAGLKNQLNSLTASRNDLTNKVSNFEERVKELEQQLGQERSNLRELASLRDQLYVELQVKQQELDTAVSRREKDISDCEREIAMYLEEKRRMAEELSKVREKENKYDEIQKDLKRIRIDAESDAFRMVEEAKVQSMEAVSVVDDVKVEIDTFKQDIGQIRSDLDIGTDTLRDRLDSLYYTLDSYVQKLCGIKAQFYAANGIPIDENGLACPAPQPEESESQTDSIQEQEQPPEEQPAVTVEMSEQPTEQDTPEVSSIVEPAEEAAVEEKAEEALEMPEPPDEVAQPVLTMEDSAPVSEEPTHRFLWDDEEAADEDEYEGF